MDLDYLKNALVKKLQSNVSQIDKDMLSQLQPFLEKMDDTKQDSLKSELHYLHFSICLGYYYNQAFESLINFTLSKLKEEDILDGEDNYKLEHFLRKQLSGIESVHSSICNQELINLLNEKYDIKFVHDIACLFRDYNDKTKLH